MKELTSANLDKVGKKEKKLYVIKFSSPSCGPCATMKPVIEELAKKNSDLSIYEVDTQKSPELAQHFEVRGVPTIKFCKRREILYSFTGLTPLRDLQYVIDNIDDPYFVEHGEFNKPNKKAPVGIFITLGLIILGYVALTIFSNSYGASINRDILQDAKHSIERVTVFSNKTLVKRKGVVNYSKKKRWVVFKGLPSTIDKSTVKIRIKNSGIKIEQTIIEDSFTQITNRLDLKKKVNRLNVLYGEQLDLLQRERDYRHLFDFVHQLEFSSPFSTENRNYLSFNANPGHLKSAFRVIEKESGRFRLKREGFAKKLKDNRLSIGKLVRELDQEVSYKDKKWITNIYLLADKNLSGKEIILTYMMGSGIWRPTYDIRSRLNSKSGIAKIRLVMSGMIEQHTGEDWKDVFITLSTRDPVPLIVPKLNRWILKEERVEEVDSYSDGAVFGGGDKSPMKSLAMPAKMIGRKAVSKVAYKKKKSRRRQMKMKALRSRVMEKDVVDFEMAVNSVPVVSQLQAPAAPISSRALYPLAGASSKYRSLMNKIDSALNSRVETKRYVVDGMNRQKSVAMVDRTLPAYRAQGFLIELLSPFKLSLRSDEAPVKVPVATQEIDATLKYFAIPKKSENVFILALAKNRSDVPILQGAAQVFLDGDLVSKTTLNSTMPDGHFRVNLGVDPNVKVKRTVEKKSVTEGIVFKDHATSVKVSTQIVNHNSFPIKLELKDNFPRSPNGDIKIKLVKNGKGTLLGNTNILKWNMTLAAKESKQIEFVYTVSHPENYIVSEFN